MSELRLAGNSILGPGNIATGFGHLQIVYVDDNGVSFEIEVQAPDNLFSGFWDIQPSDRRHDNVDNTPYYTDGANNANYRSVLLSENADADNMWAILTQIQEDFAEASITNPFFYDIKTSA